MALVMWGLVLGPAIWAGLLLSRIFQSVLALVLPAVLAPDQLVVLGHYTVTLAVFGIVLAVIGNFMVGLETGFIRMKQLWVDNLLVYLGAGAWLTAALLQGEWWLPLAGQGIAALLLTPQLGLLIARVCIRGDAFFAAFAKLVVLLMALVFLTGVLGWLQL